MSQPAVADKKVGVPKVEAEKPAAHDVDRPVGAKHAHTKNEETKGDHEAEALAVERAKEALKHRANTMLLGAGAKPAVQSPE